MGGRWWTMEGIFCSLCSVQRGRSSSSSATTGAVTGNGLSLRSSVSISLDERTLLDKIGRSPTVPHNSNNNNNASGNNANVKKSEDPMEEELSMSYLSPSCQILICFLLPWSHASLPFSPFNRATSLSTNVSSRPKQQDTSNSNIHHNPSYTSALLSSTR